MMSIFQNPLLARKTKPIVEIRICDLFRRLSTFNGKRVAVRGVYRFSSELVGLYSEGCEKPLVLDGAERAQALDTEFVGKAPEQQAEFARFTAVIDGIANSRGRQAVHVTFVGTLITRNPQLHRLGQRKGERIFGHLGVYPARLEFDGIRNIIIDEEGRMPSNMGLRK